MTEPEMPEEIYIEFYDCEYFIANELCGTKYIRADKLDEKDREIEMLLCAVADLADAIELPDNGEPVDILIKHNDAINRAYGYVNTINDDGKLSDYLICVKGE